MTVGIFLSHDAGYAGLLGADNWETGAYYALLALTTETIDRVTQTQKSHITTQLAVGGDYDHQVIDTLAVINTGQKVRFDCSKISFGAAVSITARYLFIVKGTAASPTDTDPIIGSIDLNTEGGNLSSSAAEFSYDPAASGLFEIGRPVSA